MASPFEFVLSAELARCRTPTDLRMVRLTIMPAGLKVDTQDIGEAAQSFAGDDDYECWIDIRRDDFERLIQAFGEDPADMVSDPQANDRILLDLLQQHYTNDLQAVSHLQDLCRRHGIDARFGSWS